MILRESCIYILRVAQRPCCIFANDATMNHQPTTEYACLGGRKVEKREVVYSLTKREFIGVSFAQTFRTRYGLMILLVFLILLISFGMNHAWYVPLLYLILVPIIRLYRLNRMYETRRGRKPMTLSIQPESVRVCGEGIESTIAWKYVKSCRQNRKYIFFRMENEQRFFVIPKRIFASESDATLFFENMQSYISQGQP